MAAIPCFYAGLYLKLNPNTNLQYKLKMRSLSTVWNENEHFWLVFMKMLVFVPKPRSLHTGTGLHDNLSPVFTVFLESIYIYSYTVQFYIGCVIEVYCFNSAQF
jgi:hypothetical protein